MVQHNGPHDHDNNLAGAQQKGSLWNGHGNLKDMVTSVAIPSSEDHTTESTTSHSQAHAESTVFELATYVNHSSMHELPGNNPENMATSGPASMWNPPVDGSQPLHGNDRHYDHITAGLADNIDSRHPTSFSAANGGVVTPPSQARAMSPATLAGNNPQGPLSQILEDEPPVSPDPAYSRVMSPQHSLQGYVVSPRPSQESWGMSTQTPSRNHYV